MSQPTSRRYGPAITMGLAILAAIALAALAPFNMLGSWNERGSKTPSSQSE